MVLLNMVIKYDKKTILLLIIILLIVFRLLMNLQLENYEELSDRRISIVLFIIIIAVLFVSNNKQDRRDIYLDISKEKTIGYNSLSGVNHCRFAYTN